MRVLVALLGVMVVGACGSTDSGGFAVRTAGAVDSRLQEGRAAPLTAGPGPVAPGTNRALAVAAAARALRRLPVPPGSVRVETVPRHAPRLRRLGAYDGPVDASLTRTRWWLVPLRYDRVVAWYAAHTPADPGSAFVPDATEPSPDAVLDWLTTRSSAAYSTPAYVVAYSRLGAHLTALRTDVTLAARADRTHRTLVPATVTSIDLTRTAIDGPDTSPTTRTVTDPASVLAAVAAFDRLRGDFVSDSPRGCGSPVGLVETYAVTFHWPGHTMVVDPGAELCGTGRGLTLDGSRLPETLENTGRLDRALEAAFESS